MPNNRKAKAYKTLIKMVPTNGAEAWTLTSEIGRVIGENKNDNAAGDTWNLIEG